MYTITQDKNNSRGSFRPKSQTSLSLHARSLSFPFKRPKQNVPALPKDAEFQIWSELALGAQLPTAPCRGPGDYRKGSLQGFLCHTAGWTMVGLVL